MTSPVNLEGAAFLDVQEMGVHEWHPAADGKGKPEQVHLTMKLDGLRYPVIVRFKSARPVDELIVALITHRRGVWGMLSEPHDAYAPPPTIRPGNDDAST